ncbi:MAG: 50S ribosomal protein L16 [Candidatus Buchananbacteria bacterium RBG_13_36_9]|uniref:Large ribosomal subunit protein uL16 n=1 Tax=Candidatus Buchananbacteria bacterium RBG_13_36_9 TaxID=1797530 RepID=A0A1G1XMQ4_9BACT|nr:MAG: 50S ribosomal protein L16 [Candidatus Buchananbacteria bacterium RBG_13_36_9]
MLMPKKVKFRKWHKGRKRGKGIAASRLELNFGSYGLKSLSHGWVTARQIEAARRVITHYLKKGGRVWIRIFPDKPVTKKGAEVPMGGGKGAPDHFVAIVKPGTILFEMEGLNVEKAKESLIAAGHKLPVKIKFLVK